MGQVSTRKKIIITTGDFDGIGLEVTCKALLKMPKSIFKKFIFFIYIHPNSEQKFVTKLKSHFTYLEISDESCPTLKISKLGFKSLLKKTYSEKIVLINSQKSPATWVFDSSLFCQEKIFSALVTAPLSKTLIQESGYNEIGHTEILARVSKKKNLYMLFIGSKFNVVLLTAHQPLATVSKQLLKFNDRSFCQELLKIRSILGTSKRKKPFALLGFNPHAGEKGIIGAKEELYLTQFLESIKLPFIGPLVPDVAFQKRFWNAYSIYISLYHDQGLIPFKMIHGQDSGVHITMGLPFIRTSVDHGTAKEIFGKNKANPNSMLDALLWAAKLS